MSGIQKTRADIEDLRGRLKGVFAKFTQVQAAFLFGSAAEGRFRPGSDIDVGVVPASSALRERRLELLSALVRAGMDNVDLVFLDTDDVVIRYEAIRLNCLVYAREDFDRGTYYSLALREYLDFLPFLAVQRKALKDRLSHA